MSKDLDEKALALLNEVKAKKEEIQKLNKVNYVTNLTFYYPVESRQINLNTILSVNKLVELFAFIKNNIEAKENSAKILGVINFESKFENYTLSEWTEDFKTKISIINIKQLKEDLKFKEDKLNSLISEEKRKELEFERILKDFKS
jgi:hypothetical protein